MFIITLKKEYKETTEESCLILYFFVVVYVLKFECIKLQLEPLNVFQQLFYFEI